MLKFMLIVLDFSCKNYICIAYVFKNKYILTKVDYSCIYHKCSHRFVRMRLGTKDERAASCYEPLFFLFELGCDNLYNSQLTRRSLWGGRHVWQGVGAVGQTTGLLLVHVADCSATYRPKTPAF